MTRWDEVEVCVDLERFAEPAAMGWLRRQRARSGDVFSFEYTRPWLDRGDAEVETRCDVSVALEACGDYGLAHKDATRIVREVREAVGLWREQAKALGISRGKQEEMAAAFEE